MDINESLEAFRGLPYSGDILAALRDALNLPDNYATLEQKMKLSVEQTQALVVYRLLSQEVI